MNKKIITPGYYIETPTIPGIFIGYPIVNNLIEEVWLPVSLELFPMIYPMYSISNYGRLYSHYKNRIVNPQLDAQGYYEFNFRGPNGIKRLSIHRVELCVFSNTVYDTPFIVNHRDGIKINNYLYNLEWSNHTDNLIHAYENGLHRLGEDNVLSTHTNEQIHIICRCLELRMPYKDCAEAAGIDTSNYSNYNFIGAIRRKEFWKHISNNYNIPTTKNKRFFLDEEAHIICKALEKGILYYKDILKYMGRDDLLNNDSARNTIGDIKRRSVYKEISKDYNF